MNFMNILNKFNPFKIKKGKFIIPIHIAVFAYYYHKRRQNQRTNGNKQTHNTSHLIELLKEKCNKIINKFRGLNLKIPTMDRIMNLNLDIYQEKDHYDEDSDYYYENGTVLSKSVKFNWKSFIGGIVFSNFMEYFVHNVLFHILPKKHSMNSYYIVHGHHHRRPNDIPFIPLAQTIFIYFITAIFWSNIFKLNSKLKEKTDCDCKKQLTNNSFPEFMMGGSLGFLTFELVHWLIHKPNITNKFPTLKPLVDFHWAHHTISNTAFTFTSPFWDWLFNTLPSKDIYNWSLVPIPFPVVPFILAYWIR